MKSSPLFLALAWAASLAAAFSLGFGESRGWFSHRPEAPAPPSAQASTVDAVLARAHALTLPPVGLEYLRAAAPLLELRDADLPAALAEVERSIPNPRQRSTFQALLLDQWSRLHPEAALAYILEKLGTSDTYTRTIPGDVMITWAHRDPEAAWAWFQAHLSPEAPAEEQAIWADELFTGLAQHDPQLALHRLREFRPLLQAGVLTPVVLYAGGKFGWPWMLDHLRDLPEDLRRRAEITSLQAWTQENPDAATRWLDQQPAEQQAVFVETMGSSFFPRDPARGAAFLLAHSTEKSPTYARIARLWGYVEPLAAGAWLRSQPQGPHLDSARATLATILKRTDPPAAMQWARDVEASPARQQAVADVFETWSRTDRPAAEAALDASGLPPEYIRALKARAAHANAP